MGLYSSSFKANSVSLSEEAEQLYLLSLKVNQILTWVGLEALECFVDLLRKLDVGVVV